MSSKLRTLVVAGIGLSLVALVGCSPSGSDYKSAAEDLIEGDIEELAGLGDLSATCDDPSGDPKVGDTFNCTATTTGGATIKFVATVAEDDKVNVESTNLITPEALAAIEKTAVGALEQETGLTLGAENFSCGDASVVIDVATEYLVCALTDPATGDVYDAQIDIPSLDDVTNLTVQVADQPRG